MRIAFLPLLAAGLLAPHAVAQDLPAGEVIRVPGTDTQVRLRSEDGTMHAAVSRDAGATWQELLPPDYRIKLRFREFDPLRSEPVLPPIASATANNRLWIVQFHTQIIDEYRAGLRAAGAELHGHLPAEAFVVRMGRETASEVRDLPYVRWVGELHTAFKVDPEVLGDLVADTPLGAERYNVVMVDQRRDAPALEAAIRAVGGTVDMPAQGGILVEATLTPEQVLQVAAEDTVLWIDRWGAPEVDMDNARIQSGANYVESMAGIDGKGVTGHVFEGVYNHREFGARPPYRTGPIGFLSTAGSGHGTNTAGEIFAQGLRAQAKGMVPFAQLVYTNYNRVGTSRYNMTRQLVNPAGELRVMMQTASWGNPRTLNYTSISADLDNIIFDFDLFVTQSQSNAGATSQPRASRPQAWAKNVCSIGGFRHGNNANPGDDCWCRTGSTGPASDGRIGVTLTGYYDAIFTTSGSSSYTSGFGGTSGATPMCNGLGGEVITMLTDGHFGYPATPWQQRSSATPHFSTTKALLAVSTRQLDFSRANRYQQGWGFPNMQDLYDNRDELLVLDEEDVLAQGESRTYYVWVKPNTPELRIGMQYSDPAANPGASQHRINSLDLEVSGPGSLFYRGNAGLLGGLYNVVGGEVDDLNTEECVFVENPTSGVYGVSVLARAVRQDSHVETTAVDADFALAIRGIGGGRDRSGMVVDLVSNVAGQLDVAVSGLPASGWTGGYTLFSLSTARHPSLGNLFGLEADGLSLTSTQLPQTPGDVFAFTNSGNPGEYPNATHQFSPVIANLLQGMDLDAVVVLTDASGNVVDVSNVDRVTVQ